MKTLVSVITGRKDYEVFDTDDNEKIIEYLEKNDWQYYKVTEDEEDGNIYINDNYFGGDTLKIIEVKVIKLD